MNLAQNVTCTTHDAQALACKLYKHGHCQRSEGSARDKNLQHLACQWFVAQHGKKRTHTHGKLNKSILPVQTSVCTRAPTSNTCCLGGWVHSQPVCYLFCELSSLIIAHISWWCSYQLGNSMLLHVLRHVKTNLNSSSTSKSIQGLH